MLSISSQLLFAASCNVVRHNAPTEADKALLSADYAKAEGLYRDDLAKHPGDAEMTIGLVHALVHQQKLKEAADVVKTALAVLPNSAQLLTLEGEVVLRQGEPWIVEQLVLASYKLDPCNARARLLFARLSSLNSRYATAQQQIILAHQIDPDDPEIRLAWIQTLSSSERIAELESYLASPNGQDEESLRHWHAYLDLLKKAAETPHKACHLVSTVATTEIPFIKLMYGMQHVRGFGLEVSLNSVPTRLQIDTGASGLVLYRSAADHAGLKPLSDVPILGIGDKGEKHGYAAFAESIRIGGLEFRDCAVSVIDARSPLDDDDGLIGVDVFSNFLVTLDYPMRKLGLMPLPPRLGEAVPEVPSLKTNDAESEDSGSGPANKDAQEKTALKSPESSGVANGSGPPKPANHGPYDRYIAPEMKDWTQVYRAGHDLILPAALNGQKIRLFVLDTGSFATIISPEVAREVSKVHGSGLAVRGLNGEVKKVESADEITFNFAHLSQKVNGVVSFDTSKISKGVGMEISGLLGANTLNLLIMHLDYRDGLVKFDYIPDRGYKF
jgi:predicted aspartyl protease/thioredoxin-like negative regulator of GroEL